METFEQWWMRTVRASLTENSHLRDLVRLAFESALGQSKNYVADDVEMPGKITFANGREVEIIERADGVKGYYLEVR